MMDTHNIGNGKYAALYEMVNIRHAMKFCHNGFP